MSEHGWAIEIDRMRRQVMGVEEAETFAADVEALRARLAEVEADFDVVEQAAMEAQAERNRLREGFETFVAVVARSAGCLHASTASREGAVLYGAVKSARAALNPPKP